MEADCQKCTLPNYLLQGCARQVSSHSGAYGLPACIRHRILKDYCVNRTPEELFGIADERYGARILENLVYTGSPETIVRRDNQNAEGCRDGHGNRVISLPGPFRE